MNGLQVKCPKTCENSAIDIDYLENGGGDKLADNRRGWEIYTQMQFQMFLCKVKRGILFVFSSVDNRIIYVDLELPFI